MDRSLVVKAYCCATCENLRQISYYACILLDYEHGGLVLQDMVELTDVCPFYAQKEQDGGR